MVHGAFFSAGILGWQVIIPGFGAITGPLQVTALEYSGEHNGELRFELALESAGAVTFGAI